METGPLTSVFALINSASNKKPRKLMLRILNLPRQAPKVVEAIEQIPLLKNTLPTELHEMCEDILESLENPLIASTSIKGWGLSQLTTNKTRIDVNNPQARKQAMGHLFGGGEQGYQ